MTQRLAEQDKDLPLQDADDGKSSDENSEDDNSSDKEGEFEVEEIRGKRIHRGKVQYLVKWVGYGEEDNTWEPVEHLVNSETAVNEYENIIQKKESSNSSTGINQEGKSQIKERNGKR
jgi:hypothetical protein